MQGTRHSLNLSTLLVHALAYEGYSCSSPMRSHRSERKSNTQKGSERTEIQNLPMLSGFERDMLGSALWPDLTERSHVLCVRKGYCLTV